MEVKICVVKISGWKFVDCVCGSVIKVLIGAYALKGYAMKFVQILSRIF